MCVCVCVCVVVCVCVCGGVCVPIIRPFNSISVSVEFHSDWTCDPVPAEGLVTHPART